MLEVVAAMACSAAGPTGIARADLHRYRVGNTGVMRRRLISLCGNLVEVKGTTVQFIHTTVREFLLGEADFGLEESASDGPLISLKREDSLAELARLALNYVNGFQRALQQDPWLSRMDESGPANLNATGPGLVADMTIYTKLIDEFTMLRFLYGLGPEFRRSLDQELCKKSTAQQQNLLITMSSGWKRLKLAVLEAMAQTDTNLLGGLILETNQVNDMYRIPRNDCRFDLSLLGAAPGMERLGLFHMTALLVTPTPHKTMVSNMLFRRGANVDLPDASGSTALHMTVRIGALASARFEDAVEDLLALRVVKSLIRPDLRICEHMFDKLSSDLNRRGDRARSFRPVAETISRSAMISLWP